MRPNGLTLAMGKSLWKLSGVINRRMGAKKEEGMTGGGLLISFQFTWNGFLLSGALMKFLISNKKKNKKGWKKKTRMFSENEKKTLSAQRSTFSYTYYTIYNRNLVGNHRRKIYTNFQWPRRTQREICGFVTTQQVRMLRAHTTYSHVYLAVIYR